MTMAVHIKQISININCLPPSTRHEQPDWSCICVAHWAAFSLPRNQLRFSEMDFELSLVLKGRIFAITTVIVCVSSSPAIHARSVHLYCIISVSSLDKVYACYFTFRIQHKNNSGSGTEEEGGKFNCESRLCTRIGPWFQAEVSSISTGRLQYIGKLWSCPSFRISAGLCKPTINHLNIE